MSDLASLAAELLDWSQPRQAGRKWTQSCGELTSDWWDLWREEKEELKRLGIRVAMDDETEQFSAYWVHQDDPGLIAGSASADDKIEATRHYLLAPQEFRPQYLRPYQCNAVYTLQRAVERGVPFVLDASDAGIGKTWHVLELLKRLDINFGVVCPANVVTKWTDTATDRPFELEPEFVLSYEKIRGGKQVDFITRTERIYRRKKLAEFTWNTVDRVAIVFDEIHLCSGENSLNSKILQAAIDDPNVLVVGASATAAETPLKMKVIGYGLELHQLSNWWHWCKQMGCRPGPFGGLLFNTGVNPNREPTVNQRRARRKLLEVHQYIFPERGTRIQKAEIKSQLPDNLVMAEIVDVDERDPAIKALVDAVYAKEDEDEEKAEAKEMAVSSLTLNTRARQRAEAAKLPIMLERGLNLAEQDNSVIVFLNYSASIEWFCAALTKAKQGHAKIVGGMGHDLEVNRLEFQLNHVRWIVCQTDAGSASIDLDDTDGKFPRVSLISPNYDAVKFNQVLGRPHRGPTTRSKVMQWVLFAAGTIEERVGRIVQQKLNNFSIVNDGDLKAAPQIIGK